MMTVNIAGHRLQLDVMVHWCLLLLMALFLIGCFWNQTWMKLNWIWRMFVRVHLFVRDFLSVGTAFRASYITYLFGKRLYSDRSVLRGEKYLRPNRDQTDDPLVCSRMLYNSPMDPSESTRINYKMLYFISRINFKILMNLFALAVHIPIVPLLRHPPGSERKIISLFDIRFLSSFPGVE